VQIRGIPLHVWHEKFFKKVGALFGSFLDFDEASVCGRRFDVANIIISTKRMGRIEELVRIKVMGVIYSVWVVEGDVVCEEGEGSVEEDSDLSKDRDEVWAEEDEEGRPDEVKEVEEIASGDDFGDGENFVRSVPLGVEDNVLSPRSNIGRGQQKDGSDGTREGSQENDGFFG